jgi:hypothetical protein
MLYQYEDLISVSAITKLFLISHRLMALFLLFKVSDIQTVFYLADMFETDRCGHWDNLFVIICCSIRPSVDEITWIDTKKQSFQMSLMSKIDTFSRYFNPKYSFLPNNLQFRSSTRCIDLVLSHMWKVSGKFLIFTPPNKHYFTM